MIDLEAICSRRLRDDDEIIERVDDRVWLTMPREPVFPAILIRRVGGIPTIAYQGLLVTDNADLDLHCYGGSRAEALSLAMRAEVVLIGAVDLLTARPFTVQRIPDPTMPQADGRERERYILSLNAAASALA